MNNADQREKLDVEKCFIVPFAITLSLIVVLGLAWGGYLGGRAIYRASSETITGQPTETFFAELENAKRDPEYRDALNSELEKKEAAIRREQESIRREQKALAIIEDIANGKYVDEPDSGVIYRLAKAGKPRFKQRDCYGRAILSEIVAYHETMTSESFLTPISKELNLDSDPDLKDCPHTSEAHKQR